MPQRMQPRQHGQRRAERAEHESSRGSPAMHLRPPVESTSHISPT
jgi:hypothetical protein